RLTNVKGYVLKYEFKYYLNQEHISNGYYVSIELFYKKESFNWQDTIHSPTPYLTTYRLFKDIYSPNLKYGRMIVFKSRIIFDWYIGVGVRFKNTTSTLTPPQVNDLKYGINTSYDPQDYDLTFYPGGKSIEPNFEAGFKVGYQLR
ncbi:MAG TPA: hypothetical protein VK890_12100, partial [Bacteroidia bacterium]|nr:hypothetical protein [Bacteroidia bacterium]